MVIILITNYYLNFLETKDLVKSAEGVKDTLNPRYEVTMLNPQNYLYKLSMLVKIKSKLT